MWQRPIPLIAIVVQLLKLIRKKSLVILKAIQFGIEISLMQISCDKSSWRHISVQLDCVDVKNYFLNSILAHNKYLLGFNEKLAAMGNVWKVVFT